MVLLSFKKTFKNYFPYLKMILLIAACASLPFALFEQFIFQQASHLADKTLLGCLGVLSSSLEVFLLQLVFGYGLKRWDTDCNPSLNTNSNRNIFAHIRFYFKFTLIETFRAYGKIAVGILLLILPGIYRCIQYSFINYVVQFDDSYIRGQCDALEESRRLVRGQAWKVGGLFLLTQSAIFAIQFYGVAFVLLVNPLAWFLFFVLELSLSAFFYLLFYHYYQLLSLHKQSRLHS